MDYKHKIIALLEGVKDDGFTLAFVYGVLSALAMAQHDEQIEES